MLEETVTVEEDPGTPTSHVSIVTSEDGTTRRTETKVCPGPGKKRAAWTSTGVPLWHGHVSWPLRTTRCLDGEPWRRPGL